MYFPHVTSHLDDLPARRVEQEKSSHGSFGGACRCFHQNRSRNHPLRVVIGVIGDVGTITDDVIVVRKQPTRYLLPRFYEEDVPRFRISATTETRSPTIQREVS